MNPPGKPSLFEGCVYSAVALTFVACMLKVAWMFLLP